ncbi:unnamed protein product, partial [Mesorhabditis belari]|uniref:Acid ceramidase n=1 Tax=Mesorhabditis belari TaxID=2138241 RepID=A0AAF3J3I5_9BILA
MANVPGVYDPAGALSVPWFNINLDEDPRTRWALVAQSKRQELLDTLATVHDFIATLLGDFGGLIWDMLLDMMEDAVLHLPEPYKSEILGFAEAANITPQQVTLLNLFYEISKGCTSIVAEDPNGKIFHARNQDFGTFFIWNTTLETWQQTIALKKILINVNYMKGGQVFYKGVTFAGHMGVLTGLKPHAFTLSTNSRAGSDWSLLMDWFAGQENGRRELIWADRDVLEKANSYSEAIEYLSTTPLFAGGYFIVGGTKSGEGAVITRNANGTDHIEKIDTTKPNGWYVLETNYDWDKPEFYLDARIGPGNDCMQRMTRANVGLEGLYQVLSSKPNLNKATVYTCVMQVDDIVMQSFIRDCPNPCWFV